MPGSDVPIDGEGGNDAYKEHRDVPEQVKVGIV